MSIYVYSGGVGSGKTTYMAQLAKNLLARYRSVHKRYGYKQTLYSNIRFTPLIETEFSDYIEYFNDVHHMPTFRDGSIIIDEISIYFDAQSWEKQTIEMKRFLRMHRKRNINLYCATQDFKTIDISFRRLTTALYHFRKVISTREPSPFLPKQKYPWSFTIKKEVPPEHWELEKEHYGNLGRSYYLYTKKNFAIFNTQQELPEVVPPPLKRIQRHWYKDDGTIGHTVTRYV